MWKFPKEHISWGTKNNRRRNSSTAGYLFGLNLQLAGHNIKKEVDQVSAREEEKEDINSSETESRETPLTRSVASLCALQIDTTWCAQSIQHQTTNSRSRYNERFESERQQTEDSPSLSPATPGQDWSRDNIRTTRSPFSTISIRSFCRKKLHEQSNPIAEVHQQRLFSQLGEEVPAERCSGGKRGGYVLGEVQEEPRCSVENIILVASLGSQLGLPVMLKVFHHLKSPRWLHNPTIISFHYYKIKHTQISL